MQYSTAQEIGTITKSDCFLKDCSLSKNGAKIEFGYITVPADYSNPNKKTYQIAFVIIKARNENSKPDPILKFMGGWGSYAIDEVGYWSKHKLTENNDLILYDYRGLGYSEPFLNNIKPNYDDEKYPNTPEKKDRYWTRRTNRVLDAFEANDININMFGSDTNAKDGLLLAENLGYESYNLFGISNGTLVMQYFIRAAENSSVKIRSAVLDSNVPIGYSLRAESSINFSNSLNHILSDCASNPRCNEEYPELKKRFKKLLKSFDETPMQLISEEGDSIHFGRSEAYYILMYMLVRRSLYKDVPLMVESLINKDEGALLNYFSFAPNSGSSTSPNAPISGFIYPITYSYDEKLMRNKTKDILESTTYDDEEYTMEFPVDDFFFTDERIIQDSLAIVPIKTDIPSLILAGGYDPLTPPLWSERVRPSFKNHYYFNIPKMDHGVIYQPCALEMVLNFIEKPNEKPKNNCEETLGENDINFVVGYYKNLKVETMLNDLFAKNWILIIGLGFVVIICLVSFIRGLLKIIKKRNTSITSWMTVNSFLILVTLIGLTVIVSQTLDENSVLLILGLNKSADYLMWLVPIIIVISIFIIIQLLMKKEFKAIHLLALGAFVVFGTFIFNYGLFPNI